MRYRRFACGVGLLLFLGLELGSAQQVVLVQVLNATSFLAPVEGATLAWSQPDSAASVQACPLGTYSETKGSTQCLACTTTCATEQYLSQKCTPSMDARCSQCTAQCTLPMQYQFMQCNLTQNRVCYPNRHANLTGLVTFNGTLVSAATLVRLIARDIGTSSVSVRLANTSLANVWTANVTILFLYNESFTDIFNQSQWWTAWLQEASATGMQRRLLQAANAQLMQLQPLSSTVSPCPNTYDAGQQLQCLAQPCAVGKGGSFGTCVSCVPGTYKPIQADQACTACETHYFAPNTGQTACALCGQGNANWSTVGGTACVCAPGFFGPACAACPAGTYASGSNATVCTSCTAGTYAELAGSTACTLCNKGTYSARNASACALCAVGTIAASSGLSVCTSCSAGSYAESPASSLCISCTAGTFASSAGSGTCAACAKGTYMASGGSRLCLSCTAGTYAELVASTECMTCPPGSSTVGAGSGTCVVCAAGKFSGATSCVSCAGGTYSGSNASACVSCDAGTTSGSGASTCWACAPGKATVMGVCTACAVGKYQNGTACSACDAGTYANATGLTVCSTCAVGNFAPVKGSTVCGACARGSFAARQASTACDACAAGSFAVAQASTACTQCAAGTYAAGTGTSSCLNCTTANATGATACILKATCVDGGGNYCVNDVSTPCETGYYCPASGRASCPPGYYCTGGKEDKEACPVNTYNKARGSTSISACTSCPYRKATTSVGSVSEASCDYCGVGYTWNGNGCTACASGTSTVNADQCGTCKPGYAIFGADRQCLPCKPGTYSTSYDSETCTACPINSNTNVATYTYHMEGDVPVADWNASSVSQCQEPLTGFCLPGNYYEPISGTCVVCPNGYFCPKITLSAQDTGGIRACSNGRYSLIAADGKGAVDDVRDCWHDTTLGLATYTDCVVSSDTHTFLTSSNLQVTAVATSYDGTIVFFSTATGIYQLMLDTLQTAQVTVTGQTFVGITALGVDQHPNKPEYLVIGDSNLQKVFRLDLYTNRAVLLGSEGQVSHAGGITVMGDPDHNLNTAYVTDTQRHVVMGFDILNPSSDGFLVAGNPDRAAYMDALGGGSAYFSAPKGLAFRTTHRLLVADSGNNAIREIDLASNNAVSTLFAPKDAVTPEMAAPVDVAVKSGVGSPAYTAVYIVTQAGKLLHARQYPDTLWLLTQLTNVPPLSLVALTNVNPEKAVLYVSKATALLKATETTGTSSETNAFYADTGACHFPGVEGTVNKCGNYFLDEGEECDTGDGCVNCVIQPNFACDGEVERCLSPQPAYPYTYESATKFFTAVDCLSELRPKPDGFTLDDHCQLHDINECAETNVCDRMAECRNTVPEQNKVNVQQVLGYECYCQTGFYGDGLFCNTSSWQVYATYKVPTVAFADFYRKTELVSVSFAEELSNAYAEELVMGAISSLPQISTLFSPMALAKSNTHVVQLPEEHAGSLFTVYTQFPTKEVADVVAVNAQLAQDAIVAKLSTAIGGGEVQQVQAPLSGPFVAATFTGAVQQAGWGMNITSVTYNRTCSGRNVPGGCWQLEMIYQGGSDYSTNSDSLQSMNVLYLPRLEKKDDNVTLLDPVKGFSVENVNMFPCSGGNYINGQTRKSGTSCCLRDFQSLYRPSAAFTDFLQHDASFNSEATTTTCGKDSFGQHESPNSQVVYNQQRADGTTNDMVVGDIEGLPYSTVELVETVDYSKRIFKVRLLLEEGDLRKHAAAVKGALNAEYTLTFFVGLANFQPVADTAPGLYTSMLQSRSMQQRVVVTKSNVLTVSTFGANQDPLVGFSSLQLERIRVTDYFQPLRFADLLVPTFTLPSGFTAPPNGGSVVPLGSIRVVKSDGAAAPTDPNWQQACPRAGLIGVNDTTIYSDENLHSLYAQAQKQSCVPSDLRVCVPPASASNQISFGVPLPEGYLTDGDLAQGSTEVLTLNFVVTGYNPSTNEKTQTTLSMSLALSPLALTTLCVTRQASQSLKDIVSGTVVIGTATTDLEWTQLQKKQNFDSPGYGKDATPSESFEFATTTVQGAIMTFAALGDPGYFEDSRASLYDLRMNDLYTVHFLEPLLPTSGLYTPTPGKTTKLDPAASPKYNEIKAMLLNGTAFDLKQDKVTGNAWLVPSPALIARCPYVPYYGNLACVTRLERTMKDNSFQESDTTKEVLPFEDTTPENQRVGVLNVQQIVASVMNNGVSSIDSKQTGKDFQNQVVSHLGITTANNRYRKAYMVNPVLQWTTNAIQKSQPGANPQTVCTKIMALGLITIMSPSGKQQFRRLLSIADTVPPAEAVTKDQSPQGQVVSLENVPGHDGATLLCQLIMGAQYSQCKVEEYQVTVPLAEAAGICAAHQDGTLSAMIQSELTHKVVGISKGMEAVSLLDYSITGCNPVSAGRRLLGTQEVVILHKNLALYNNTTNTVNLYKLMDYLGVKDTQIWVNALAGGAYVSYVTVQMDPGQVTVNVTVQNVTNITKIGQNKTEVVTRLQDTIFTRSLPEKSAAPERVAVTLLNLLILAAASYIVVS